MVKILAMPRKRDQATELAEKLAQTLEEQRRLGPDAYPLTLRRLVALTEPGAADALVLQAIGKKKEFSSRVVLAGAKTLDAPLAFVEDIDRLATSPVLLEYVLAPLCSEAQPAAAIAQVQKARLPSKLKTAFAAALRRGIQDGTLPPTVAVVTLQGQPCLHWKRFPLVRKPEEALADRLVQLVQAQRRRGGSAYPLTLSQLIQLAGPEADPQLLHQALAQPSFTQAVILALPKMPDTPLALADDRELLAGSALLLQTLVCQCRVDAGHALTVTALKKPLPTPLGKLFDKAVSQQIIERRLPPGISSVWRQSGKKREPLLFLLHDVRAGSQQGEAPAELPRSRPDGSAGVSPCREPTPLPPPANFAPLFDQAFAQLDRQAGSHNLVSLVELRRLLPFDRPAFDEELKKLRLEGRYVLKLAEGRHGLSVAEQEAGIVEDGRLLLYVARKLP